MPLSRTAAIEILLGGDLISWCQNNVISVLMKGSGYRIQWNQQSVINENQLKYAFSFLPLCAHSCSIDGTSALIIVNCIALGNSNDQRVVLFDAALVLVLACAMMRFLEVF